MTVPCTCTFAKGADPILVMTGSLQSPESGLEHQDQAALLPEWRRPDELRPLHELMAPFLSRVPKPMRALYDPELPIELRMAPFITPWDETQRPPRRAIWMRARAPLPTNLRRCEGGGDARPLLP